MKHTKILGAFADTKLHKAFRDDLEWTQHDQLIDMWTAEAASPRVRSLDRIQQVPLFHNSILVICVRNSDATKTELPN